MQTQEVSEVIAKIKDNVNTVVMVQGILMNDYLVPDKLVSTLSEHDALRLDYGSTDDKLGTAVRHAISDYDDLFKFSPARVVGKLHVSVFKPFQGSLRKITEVKLYREGYLTYITAGEIGFERLDLEVAGLVTVPAVLSDLPRFMGKKVGMVGVMVNFSP